MWWKKGAMGVGVMMIFIALLIVAAIGAGVLIMTNGSLQEDGLETGEMAERQVTTGVKLVDLSATDGRDGCVEDFKYLVKLSPGGQPVNLDSVVLYINTNNETVRLIYKEGECVRNNPNGYYTIS